MKIKFYKLYMVLFLFTIISISSHGETNTQQNANQKDKIGQNIKSVFQEIALDFSEGIITFDESILFMVYTIFEQGQLPDRYQGLESDGELTWVFSKILREWDKLSNDTREKLRKYGFSNYGTMERPTHLNSTKESTHFKVFYSVIPGDTNAVSTIDENFSGTPDYVENVLAVMEYVWRSEIDSMGFTEPPGDSVLGGNSKYDIYLYKLTPNVFGFAAPESHIGNNPNSTATEKNAYTSYIALRNNYSQFQRHTQLENIQVTAAHEFFHAVQFGYDAKEMHWLMEATATWIEDEVYDDINDNISYLTSWFKFPSFPLDATNAEFKNHWYGSWIFFRFISEHLGGQSTIKKIWEKSIDYDSKIKDYSFKAIDEALKTKNSNFKIAFKDFAVSNLFQTIAPFQYEEANLYPSIKIAREIFQSKNNINYSIKRHGTRYIRVFPNVVPSSIGLDEIEFTVTPTDPTTELELIIATKSSGNINAVSSFLSGGIINYSLPNSSKKDEIYAIIVNLDTSKTDFSLDISYKGNLVKLNNLAVYSYGRLSDNYYINRRFRETINSSGDFQTDFIVTRYNLIFGSSRELIFNNSDAGEAYLAKTNGDMFIIAYDLNRYQNVKYGYHLFSIKELGGDFEVNQFPAVDNNRVFFYGDLFNPDFSKGILSSDLKTGNPEMILDLTDTDFSIGIIESEGNSFVALKNNYSIPNSDELISFTNNSLNTFYTPDADNNIMSLVYNNDFAAWSEIDNGFSNTNIKAYDFSTNTLKTIRAVDGLDIWSVATSAKRVVWWENTTGAAKIKLWMNDTTTTIRSTFKGLYLDDNGVSSSSFDVPIDTGGVAWMENDFTLYYYNFRSSSLNSYDLSNYFDDKSMTTYLVKLSGKSIIIEALSSVTSDKVGTYLFKLGDITTGINDAKELQLPIKFSLSQNYPNPFNPSTVISYSIPAFDMGNIFSVQLKIYDILGREIQTLVNEKKPPGNYEVHFNADNLASGVYFYKIIAISTSSEITSFIKTKKMLLLK